MTLAKEKCAAEWICIIKSYFTFTSGFPLLAYVSMNNLERHSTQFKGIFSGTYDILHS